jgi:hypothetical protein
MVVQRKERVADGEGVVLKMTMNSTMLIKSYGVVLHCQITDIFVMFSDPVPVFFNSSNETDSLSKV